MKINREGAFYQRQRDKITQVVLFSFFHATGVASNLFELFSMGHLAFYTILIFHFKSQILYASKLASLSWWNLTQMLEGAFCLWNDWN